MVSILYGYQYGGGDADANKYSEVKIVARFCHAVSEFNNLKAITDSGTANKF